MNLALCVAELQAAVPAVEHRHVVELGALVAGAKNVVRVVVAKHERLAADSHLTAMGLRVALCPFALAVDFTTTTGDRFMTHVPADDPAAESFVFLVARESSVLANAVEIERLGDSAAAGKMYGYPGCCVDAYGRIADGDDWVRLLLQSVVAPGHVVRAPAWSNRIGSLFDGYGFLPDYFPCSMSCERARVLALQLRQACLDVGLGALVDQTERVLQRTIVVWHGLLIQSVDAIIANVRLSFDGARALRFDWAPSEPFDAALLDLVTAASADHNGVTLEGRLGHPRLPRTDPDGFILFFDP